MNLKDYERWLVGEQWNGYALDEIMLDAQRPTGYNTNIIDWACAYDALRSLFILCAGFHGEGGEVIEHFKKFIRDGKFDRIAVAKELGDRLAYLTWLAAAAGITLEEIAGLNKAKLDARRMEGIGVKSS